MTALLEYLNYGNILKGEKIVIPRTLRKEMLAKIHTSHSRIVKCKQRSKMFFYGQARDGKRY